MKKIMLYFSALLVCGSLVFIGCVKKDTKPDDASTQQQNADDDARIQNESNSAADDANSAIAGSNENSSARMAATTSNPLRKTYLNIVAGSDSVVVDSTSTRTITIYYNKISNVNGRKRSGTITITSLSGTPWSQAGSQILLKFNLTCTRVKDTKTITLTGSKTITNVNGGLVSTLGVGQSVTHRIQAPQDSTGLTITFDNGKTVNWHTDRTRTITYVKTDTILGIPVRAYKVTLIGNGIQAGNSSLAWWGVDRQGENFYASIPTQIDYDQSVDWLGPISGALQVTGTARPFNITYGVDGNGNIVSNPSAGNLPYGYEISWTDLNGKSRTVVLPY